jgi:hypothetical protein
MKYIAALLSLATATAAVTADCDSYCATITTGCTDQYAQYNDEATCLAVCAQAAFDLTTVGSTGDNTLGCRQYHAEVALNTTAPDPHCAHAGPSGGGVCGESCEAWSSLADICTPVDGAGSNVNTAGVCDNIPAGTVASYSSDSPDTTDTILCRIYHWTVAANSSSLRTVHCPHGSVGADATHCGTTKVAYCRMMAEACPATFSTTQDCLDEAGALPLGQLDDQAGNTLYCRVYHAGAAMPGGSAATTHCPHASGTTVCVGDSSSPSGSSPSSSGSDSGSSSDASTLIASGLAVLAAVLAL